MSALATLKAIKTAEQILILCAELTDEEIDVALEKLGQADATYGILWGCDGRKSSDLDFYNLKAEVLRCAQKFRANKVCPVCYLLAAKEKSS